MKKMISLLMLLVIAVSFPAAKDITRNPHGKLSWECFDCHNTSSWASFKEPMAFKHDKTGFPLIGGHSRIACGNCHKNLKFALIGSACADCHADIHRAQFGNDCQSCHSEKSWKNNKDIFALHASRGFPLVGVHAIADCISCHVGQQQNEFANTPVDCEGCHNSNFDATTDPNHTLLGFPSDCMLCHSATSSSWAAATFKEHPAAFPLHGAHANIGCTSCHTGGYAHTNSECYSCHAAAYNATAAPSHTIFSFATSCVDCHNDITWNQTQFNHVLAGHFALNGTHAAISCMVCHVNNQVTGLPIDCYGCHENNFSAANNPNHIQGNFPHTCLICHNENSWSPATFDHATSRFPLSGAHASLQCIACHASGYQNTPFDCYSCHQANFDGAINPNHAQNNFSHDCAQCHSNSGWSPATFSHANTRFPLTGAHISLACISCHAGGYQNTPFDCYSCHQANFEGTTDPNHVTNNFSHDCTQCHNTSNWGGNFDHATFGFALTGAHASLLCAACHASGYQNTPADCFSCHQANFNGVIDPNHVQNNFDHNCSICHSTTAWNPATFDHANTPFPLTGAHISLACISCHANGYQNTPADCYSCHQVNFNGVTDPNHVQNNFDHNCLICHSTTAWNPATFDHINTRFPLTGAHNSLACIACHANGYQNTPFDCYSCHQANFNGVSDPNHVQNNFDHNCLICHSTIAWNPATFDHVNTRFPLTGAHISLACIACHANGYQNTPFDCYSCHANDFNQTTDPNHVQNNYSHDCTQCHNTSSWGGNINHAAFGFALTGAHASLQCIACHANGYLNTPTDCYSCHQSNYDGAANPNHTQNNFDHNCTICHNTAAWQPSTFNHNSSPFPLTGAHASLQCIACHANGYVNTPSDCYSCHQANFVGVTDPNHVTDNFSHDCTQCHTTSGWSSVTFNHNITQFPLTGAHISVQCIACHAHGYDHISTVCFSCHQTDYNNTNNPNHLAAGFPTTCATCHNTSAWSPSSWNHDTQFFPIYSGNHQGRWSSCADCHVNPNNYQAFECILCHQHNRTDTDSHHQAVPNYQYNSQACYACHPRGNSGG